MEYDDDSTLLSSICSVAGTFVKSSRRAKIPIASRRMSTLCLLWFDSKISGTRSIKITAMKISHRIRNEWHSWNSRARAGHVSQ